MPSFVHTCALMPVNESPHKDRSSRMNVCVSMCLCVCVLSEHDLQYCVGYNSWQTEFPAHVLPSFRNALDRMESTTDVPCLKTEAFGCDF